MIDPESEDLRRAKVIGAFVREFVPEGLRLQVMAYILNKILTAPGNPDLWRDITSKSPAGFSRYNADRKLKKRSRDPGIVALARLKKRANPSLSRQRLSELVAIQFNKDFPDLGPVSPKTVDRAIILGGDEKAEHDDEIES